MRRARSLLVPLVLLGSSTSVGLAEALPCQPCAGVRVEDPRALLPQLTIPPTLDEGSVLFVAWDERLDGSTRLDAAGAVDEVGAIPWLRLRFTTPAPLSANLDRLEAELEVASSIAAAAGPRARFQVLWAAAEEAASGPPASDYAFLLKRAAVAVTGAQAAAQVVTQPLPAKPELLEALYAQEIAAYVEGVALRPAGEEALRAAIDRLAQLDPGKPVVVDALPYPERPEEALAIAARQSVLGVSVSLFDGRGAAPPSIAPLKLLAREFRGDLSFDPYSTPRSSEGTEAWSFVRGEDLGLRVIVFHGPREEVAAVFSDRQLRRPTRIEGPSGNLLDMYGITDDEGYRLRWQTSETVTLLRLERLTAEEIEGIAGLEEELTVTSERPLPVEEILRRLQAVEDAQNRRVATYRALNTTHLRFQFGTEGVEVTFQGEIFYRRDQGYDWAWQRFNLNGLEWKGRRFPRVPLIQPERAANPPLEVLFTPDYLYRLRGTAIVDGRDCWVVDFRPRPLAPGESLFRGTVWIDRQLYVRVRSRAVQVGLEGDVISNEETIYYTPVDAMGQPAPWEAASNWLPLRVVSQQVWSLFNTATVVEKETLLAEVSLNDPDFESRRQELLASKVTMVRDTDQGMRYLITDKKTGERVVQEQFDSNRVFFGGGVFYDRSLDYPLPLAGIDYFSLDFLNSGSQLNVFFAGALLNASFADPQFLGSRFDAGVDLFALAVRGSDTRFRDNQEISAEEIRQRQASVVFNLGRPLNSFTKLDFSYRLRHTDYARSDNTAEEFVLPVDHLTHTLRLGMTYNRSGYRFRVDGSYNARSEWQPWGLPDSGDYDPDQEDYLRWGARLAKTFHLQRFRKAGFELQYVDGRNLDRFSKYDLGFFSDVRVRGYESNRVRAERATATTASYGFDMGEVFRLQLLGDAAWVTDRPNGLEQEFLAGVGLAGTVIGPWQTIVRIDLGKAVAGPDDGYAVFLTFLKLYR